MPGDKATTAAELLYAQRSNFFATHCRTGFFKAPIAIGISGHKSRTSNTIGTFNLRAVKTAGSAIVKGVLVAKTTSPCKEAAFFCAANAKAKNALIRCKKLMWLE